MIYELTEEERDAATITGKARTERARSYGLSNTKKSPKSQEYIDLNGACGEIAFIGMLLKEQYIDLKTYEEQLAAIKEAGITSAQYGLDDGDVIISGNKVDVKTTEYDHGTLWLTYNKRGALKIDTYVLLTGCHTVDWTYTFRGWLSSKEILSNWDNRMTAGRFFQYELNKVW